MKVLHVFPQLTPDSLNGSERYEYLLARKLAALGVEIELLTTTTREFVPGGPFVLNWPHQQAEGITEIEGIRVRRFRAAGVLPTRLKHLISRRMLDRWGREEQRYGAMAQGSRNLIDYYYRRARERPRIYDLVTLGRGPFSHGLISYAVRNIRRFDAVQVGFVPFALTWQIVALARLFRKPSVVLALFHPDDIYHHFRSIYWSFSAADAVLAQTAFSAALLRRFCPRSNPIDLGAGVDLEAFSDARVSGERFRAKYGMGRKKIVLFVGRKEALKRYDLAVEAIHRLNREDVHLVMIGRDIDRVPVSGPQVTYLGEVSPEDLGDAYDACDIFLLPSQAESFGMVFLEAWTRRKPVIGNARCGPVAALIEDGKDGVLCRGAGEIAAAAARLIADPELARALGENGYRKVTSRYTWSVLARRVLDLYTDLAANRRQE